MTHEREPVGPFRGVTPTFTFVDEMHAFTDQQWRAAVHLLQRLRVNAWPRARAVKSRYHQRRR
ncbi:hypothetical protein ACIBKY_51105 [Nonomuraea sp. NPDC050394]|uniref:hypothetical protein n=1 Tax=Nonomuraea sp. NPDC050394 TaxID=3364363 RepID=UPI0037A69BF8